MHTKLGPFQILEVVGRGGMGTVYRGLDPIIGRPVAVKVIRLVGYNDKDEQGWLKERLFKEARAAGCLCHPGIVTIYQVGEENDVAYIAMEFVDGPSLHEVLLADEAQNKAVFCRVLMEAAEALDYAHQRGLVHRDIKPANIMLTSAGVTKVTDFGIAKTMLGQTATKTGVIIGTPFYMSPEQIRGKSLDGRSDQFALAVVAYEIFTGRKPFHAEQMTSVCYQIIHEEPLSPEDVKPGIGGEVGAVIKRALSKDAQSRYPTCRDFAAALSDAYEKTCAARPERITAQTEFLNPTTPTPQLHPPRKRQLWALLGISILLAVVVALTVFKRSVISSAAQQPQAIAAAVADRLPRAPKSIDTPVVTPHPSAEVEEVAVPRHLVKVEDHSNRRIEMLKRGGPIPPAMRISTLIEPQTVQPPPVEAPRFRGFMVWTGNADKGDLLTINGSHPSRGAISGSLPGRPADVEVFPARITSDGLVVLASQSRFLSEGFPLGKGTFVFDPRHATDLNVYELPNEGNEWKRIVLRVNTAISAFIVLWQH